MAHKAACSVQGRAFPWRCWRSVRYAQQPTQDQRSLTLLIFRVAREKALPFDSLIPNEIIIAAMREARTGNLKSFDSVDALMADLHVED